MTMKKIIAMLLIGSVVTTILPGTMQTTFADTTENVESNSDAEKERIYQEAYQEIKENCDYSKAEELLKDIEDYKDSSELIERYEKMKTTRYIDGKFYWQPQEYVQVLKQNLLALEDDYTNIDVTGGTTTPEDGTTDTITISYSDGSVDVLLQNIGFNSNNDAESFGKIKVQGTQGSHLAYPTIVAIATLRHDEDIDTAKGMISKLTDLNPHGEFTQDGLKYIFNNDGTVISFEIEPDGENVVAEDKEKTAADKNIQQEPEQTENVTDERNTQYEEVIKAYYAIKDTLKDPESIKVYGVREHDSDLIFRCTATNSFGGTVTDYIMYSGGKVMPSSVSDIAESYYEHSAENTIDWDAVVEYSQSSAYTGTPIE